MYAHVCMFMYVRHTFGCARGAAMLVDKFKADVNGEDVCMHICMYIYIYILLYVCTSIMCTCTAVPRAYMYVCMYVCMYARGYIQSRREW